MSAADVLARELEDAHRENRYWPYLRQWLVHRADMIARGNLIEPPGWGDPRRLRRT